MLYGCRGIAAGCGPIETNSGKCAEYSGSHHYNEQWVAPCDISPI